MYTPTKIVGRAALLPLGILTLAIGIASYRIANSAPKIKSRNYHPIAIADMTAENPAEWTRKMHTHVEVTGYVTYVKAEDDGDTHIRICDNSSSRSMDNQHCIVAECIPDHLCQTPKKSSKVIVRGISRYDAESPGHHWWEIHPVETITVVP